MAKVIIEKLTEDQINKKGIRVWPVWSKEVSSFDWYYDSEEECLILEGEFEVETAEGNFIVHTGDFVTFKKGLKCLWKIKTPVKKHYCFKD